MPAVSAQDRRVDRVVDPEIVGVDDEQAGVRGIPEQFVGPKMRHGWLLGASDPLAGSQRFPDSRQGCTAGARPGAAAPPATDAATVILDIMAGCATLVSP
jgi:hypothetical protein